VGTMDGSRGAITTMRSLGCGGPPTTDTAQLRGGRRLNEIAQAAWSHTHTNIFGGQAAPHCDRASGGGGGSEGIARGPWTGTRTAICRWQAVRHRTQNDLRGGRGSGRRPRVASWLVRGAFGEAGGQPPPTVPFSGGAAVNFGPRGASLAPA